MILRKLLGITQEHIKMKDQQAHNKSIELYNQEAELKIKLAEKELNKKDYSLYAIFISALVQLITAMIVYNS